jgi:DNA-binding NarL/FixJ family response regulator
VGGPGATRIEGEVESRAAAPRVVIADDHPPMRSGVRAVLSGAGYEVVEEVATSPAAVDAVAATHPDVVLLDVRMPGDGLTAAERIVVELPDVAVVMLTSADDVETLGRAFRAGVHGVLPKDDAVHPGVLPAALARVLAGDVTIPSAVVERMAVHRDPPHRRLPWGRRHAPPPRNSCGDVLDQLRAGATIAATAAALDLPQAEVRGIIATLLGRAQAAPG